MKKTGFYLLILGISLIYLFLRTYKLDQKIEFRMDQGIHLLETRQMITDNKIRLIGPMVTSKSYDGRNFYIGGNYYYALAILGVISRWDPVKITALYNIIELLFIIFFIFWLRLKYNSQTAIIIFVFLTFFDFLITHSRFFWNPHFLVPLGILFVYFLDLYQRQKQSIFLFLASVILGNAISFHYTATSWLILITIPLILAKKRSIWQVLIIIFGIIIGAFPLVLFELRHSFYNLKTIFFIFTHFKENSGFTPHYLVYPILIFTLSSFAYFQNKFKSKKFFIIISTLLLFIAGYFTPSPSPLDNLSGWAYQFQKKAATLITQNGCPKNYNIASTIGGDTRAYDLRYLLTISQCPPMEVEQYLNNQTLFLVAPTTRPPETETVWEVNSFKPFKVTQQQKINDQVVFYRLNKS